MSPCLEYLSLHHSYVEALRDWNDATVLGNKSEIVSTEVERRDAFCKLSHHKDHCPECHLALTSDIAVLSEG